MVFFKCNWNGSYNCCFSNSSSFIVNKGVICKAPPNTAYIITGPFKQRVLIGRAGLRIPGLEQTLGVDIKAIIVGYLGAKAIDKVVKIEHKDK